MTDVHSPPSADSPSTTEPSPTVTSRALDLINQWYDMFETWILADKRSLYGASLARILSGCSVMGILITNFRVRNLLFGQGPTWSRTSATRPSCSTTWA
jgi:hypothetical protein